MLYFGVYFGVVCRNCSRHYLPESTALISPFTDCGSEIVVYLYLRGIVQEIDSFYGKVRYLKTCPLPQISEHLLFEFGLNQFNLLIEQIL